MQEANGFAVRNNYATENYHGALNSFYFIYNSFDGSAIVAASIKTLLE